MIRDDFAVFILTHGRPNDQHTLKAVKKIYKGKIYLILDNEDNTIEEYEKKYGKENIIIFDKKEIAKKVDTADNIDKRNVILFARKATYEIARKLNIKYFLQLDDDYTDFFFRKEKDGVLKSYKMKNLNEVIDLFLDFLKTTNSKTVCMAQKGELIGGAGNIMIKKGYKRKAMNTFFCDVDNEINFKGRMNDDVTAYVVGGNKGELYFTISACTINQLQTQSIEGGTTDLYKEFGTYTKTFYSFMQAPAQIEFSTMGMKNRRIHHRIKWENTTPKIISEKYKKGEKHGLY